MVEVSVTKSFKNIYFNFSFLSSKNRLVLFGPSGAGKSTILKMVAGFIKPDSGRIVVSGNYFFDAERKVNIPINMRNVGYMSQEYTLFPNITVEENILYGIKVQRRKYREKDIKEIIEKLGLNEKLNDYPHNISGGQRQRAALARLLLVKPSIMLLDEPFSSLNAHLREDLRQLVYDIVSEMDIPAVFVTHDIDEAYIFADEIVVVDNQRIIEYGMKDKIFKNPDSVHTAVLLNIKNIWEIEKIEKNIVKISGGLEFNLDKKIDNSYSFMAIRAENIMIIREDIPVNAKYNKNIFTGIVKQILFKEHTIDIVLIIENSLNIFHINIPNYVFTKLSLLTGKKIRVAIDEKYFIFCRY